MRRKDPVKRTIWAATLLVAVMLVWSSSLQLKAMMTSREVGKTESIMSGYTNDYQQVVDNQRKMDDVRLRLAALHQMTANRLLQANILNALQKTTVEDVQLMHYKIDQTYAMTEATKAKTNSDGRVILGKPAEATEHVALSLDGSDSSANPGDQVTKFKETLHRNAYFQEYVGKTNAFSLKNLTTPEVSPITGKRSVNFTLECKYPDKTR